MRSSSSSSSSCAGPLGHVLGGEAELGQHPVAGGGGAEAVDADAVVGPAVPAERRRRPRRPAWARRAAGPRPDVRSACSAKRSQQGSERDLGVDALGGEQLGGRRRRRATSLPVPTSTRSGVLGGTEHVAAAVRPARRRCPRGPGGPGGRGSARWGRRARRRAARPRRSRWRRPGGSRAGRGWPAARRRARPAGGWGRPRRRRPSRG